MSVWNRLTEPPASVSDPLLRQRMRFQSILALCLVVLSVLAVVIWHNAVTPSTSLFNIDDPIFPVIVPGGALLVIGYFLSRTRKYHSVSGIIAVTILFVGAVGGSIMEPEDYPALIMYLVAADLLASLLFRVRDTLITLGLSLAAITILPACVPAITTRLTFNALTTVGFISSLIVVGIWIRQHDLHIIEQQARLLARAKQQAESANKLKSVFLGMISHELRTPLNNIMGYSDQMLMGLTGELSGDTLEAAERIHRNSQNLHRMINDLLMLSRLDGGSLTIVQRPFMLVDLLAEVDRTFRDMAEGKGLRFSATMDGSLPAVTVGDHHRIEQIVFNLISNAVKFTDRGEVSVRLRQSSTGEWSVEVRDTGIGIPTDAAGQIFDRFYQVDSTSRRSHGGAGLGLAIARELAILMGGNITVESALGAGSTFTMILPLTMDEPAIQAGDTVPAA